ncbi:hypothetical protein [Bacillus sp. NSP9.1]|uniref:hypothetical protein n=1 Tax=Bacillus sp. NSP9.1 TaxID=1071078 RepID=UPI00047D0721|nr:hypothetical protein [Bacillus sp. NSP9.1]QHZ46361.1 hypothetical protein M654_008665 [Bacillus sp. NSP9.1]
MYQVTYLNEKLEEVTETPRENLGSTTLHPQENNISPENTTLPRNDVSPENETTKGTLEKTLLSFDLPEFVWPRIRKRRHRIAARLTYPKDMEATAKNCFDKAVIAALLAGGGTLFTPAGMAAAVPAMKTAFVSTLLACLGESLYSSVDFDLFYESRRV